MSNAGVVEEKCLRDKSISFVVGPSLNIPRQQEKATQAVQNFIKEENGRFYLCEGAIWPSNDENAVGIVAKDTDITDGAVTFALVVDGNVRVESLPAAPTAAAVSALTNINFIPKQQGSVGQYLVTVPTVANATITIAEGNSILVADGGSFSFKVTAAEGHTITSVKSNSVDVPSEGGVYTISNIKANQTIAVVIA